MKRFMTLVLAGTALMGITAASANPIMVGGRDDGYARLARWEQHLDDRIADGVNRGSLNPRRAWHLQKDLDSIEAHALQSHYENNGIDRNTFRTYAGQLRGIASQLGDTGWGAGNIYGDGWSDQTDPNWHGDRGQYHGQYQGRQQESDAHYYRQGDYEQSCRQGNVAAGTIFGAVAGGLVGSAVSHGNGGAVVGGVIVGGALGNALSRDISCDDQRYAYSSYGASLNGDLDRDYDWSHGDSRGTFRSTREYRDGNQICRDFRAVTYRDGQRFERNGTACRAPGENWQTR